MQQENSHTASEWRILSQWQIVVYNIGGILMVVGALAYALRALHVWAWLIYCLGVLGYAGMQLYASYVGQDMVLKRLRRQQVLSSVLLLLSAGALIVAHFKWWLPLAGNVWLMLLLIATVFQLYTAFRIPMVMKAKQ